MFRLFRDRLSPALQSNVLYFSAVKSSCPPSLQDCSSQFMWSLKKKKKKKNVESRGCSCGRLQQHFELIKWWCMWSVTSDAVQREEGREQNVGRGGNKCHLLFFECQPEQDKKKKKLNIPVEKKTMIHCCQSAVSGQLTCVCRWEDIYVCVYSPHWRCVAFHSPPVLKPVHYHNINKTTGHNVLSFANILYHICRIVTAGKIYIYILTTKKWKYELKWAEHFRVAHRTSVQLPQLRPLHMLGFKHGVAARAAPSSTNFPFPFNFCCLETTKLSGDQTVQKLLCTLILHKHSHVRSLISCASTRLAWVWPGRLRVRCLQSHCAHSWHTCVPSGCALQ